MKAMLKIAVLITVLVPSLIGAPAANAMAMANMDHAQMVMEEDCHGDIAMQSSEPCDMNCGDCVSQILRHGLAAVHDFAPISLMAIQTSLPSISIPETTDGALDVPPPKAA